MTVNDLKDLWNFAVAGPELLFALRMASLLPLGMYAFARWYSLFFPVSAGETGAGVQVFIRFTLAMGTSLLSVYFLLSGLLEFDRAHTPFRLVIANIGQTLLFWSLLMLWLVNRKNYWETKARAELRSRRATDARRVRQCVDT